MINLLNKVSDKFNKLPKEIKACFYIMLNAFTLLIVRDLEALKGTNEYIDILIMTTVNILLYIALNFKSKTTD
jgi:hypothetical protein